MHTALMGAALMLCERRQLVKVQWVSDQSFQAALGLGVERGSRGRSLLTRSVGQEKRAGCFHLVPIPPSTPPWTDPGTQLLPLLREVV